MIPERVTHARWWRVRLRSFLYLCLRIFFRRFLTTLPIGFFAALWRAAEALLSGDYREKHSLEITCHSQRATEKEFSAFEHSNLKLLD